MSDSGDDSDLERRIRRGSIAEKAWAVMAQALHLRIAIVLARVIVVMVVVTTVVVISVNVMVGISVELAVAVRAVVLIVTGIGATVMAVVLIKALVHMAMPVGIAAVPGASPPESAAIEPFGAVVAVGSAMVWRIAVVPIRADWRGTDAYAH